MLFAEKGFVAVFEKNLKKQHKFITTTLRKRIERFKKQSLCRQIVFKFF